MISNIKHTLSCDDPVKKGNGKGKRKRLEMMPSRLSIRDDTPVNEPVKKGNGKGKRKRIRDDTPPNEPNTPLNEPVKKGNGKGKRKRIRDDTTFTDPAEKGNGRGERQPIRLKISHLANPVKKGNGKGKRPRVIVMVWTNIMNKENTPSVNDPVKKKGKGKRKRIRDDTPPLNEPVKKGNGKGKRKCIRDDTLEQRQALRDAFPEWLKEGSHLACWLKDRGREMLVIVEAIDVEKGEVEVSIFREPNTRGFSFALIAGRDNPLVGPWRTTDGGTLDALLETGNIDKFKAELTGVGR